MQKGYRANLFGTHYLPARLWDRQFFRRTLEDGQTYPLEWCQNRGPRNVAHGGKILSDMADNSDGTPAGDIVAKHARELIGKLKGGGRKRKSNTVATAVVPKKVKRAAKEPSRTTQNVHIETYLPNRHHLLSRPWSLQS